VLDRSTSELTWFASDGSLRRRSGGNGDGPGELRQPLFVPSLYNDSLPVANMTGRISLFAADASFGRSVESPGLIHAPRGVIGPQLVITSPSTIVGPSAEEGWQMGGTEVHLVDMNNGTRRAAFSLAAPPFLYTIVGGTASLLDPSRRPRIKFTQAPYMVQPSVVSQPGGIWVSDGSAFQIAVYTPAGSLARIFRVDAQPARLTAGMVRAEMARVLSREADADMRSRMMRFVDAAPAPDRMPGFDALATDNGVRVWARIYQSEPAANRNWVVFTDDGAALGVVAVPVGMEVLSINGPYLLARVADSTGVHSVVRTRLLR
jgi:hypothetical protein